uniref:PIPK domain-containing protein n=1 Tax=Heterosigma akashiwo TaxID=2829 RepID=A0A7S4D6X0_HETAK
MDYSLLVGVTAPTMPLDHHQADEVAAEEAKEEAPDKRVSKIRENFFSPIHGQGADEHYFIGIIDILTPYNAAKKGETMFKSMMHWGRREKIAAVDPEAYAKRFQNFMSTVLV